MFLENCSSVVSNEMIWDGRQELIKISRAKQVGYIHVFASHPDMGHTFDVKADRAKYSGDKSENQFVVFVSLGSVKGNGSPSFWIARKNEVGELVKEVRNYYRPDPRNNEARFGRDWLDKK